MFVQTSDKIFRVKELGRDSGVASQRETRGANGVTGQGEKDCRVTFASWTEDSLIV